ncbi:MAG: ABC transporter permease [Nitrospira sp.]|nr:ABC transporter permease [Nitrospira sp.]MDH5723901.1 ABC transporter permease [Nitrospira sp.]
MAWRETRAAWRHFLYFLVCIAIGVGALTGVSLFGTQVERTVTKEARGLLGGDLEIRLSRPISPNGQEVLDSLSERGIVLTHVSELVAMAARAEPTTVGQPTQIVELKAIESEYPLYGSLRVEPDTDVRELLRRQDRACSGLACFGVVVQESLLIRMGLSVGDQLKIGQAQFVINGVVRTEPDRMANAFSLGPRVLMSQEGLHAAELIKVGSRVRERYLLKTPSHTPPEPLLYELRARLTSESARVSSYREAQPQLRQSLEQLTRYLGLIGLTALFVGGLGVATSVHAFVREKLNTIAILKTVGADSQTIVLTYGLQALMLGLVGSLVGLLIGILLHLGLPWVIAAMVAPDLLDQLGFTNGGMGLSLPPLLKGLALGMLSTLLFTLWPLLTIRDVKPARIFRREVTPSAPMLRSGRIRWWVPWRTLDRIKLLVSIGISLGLALLSIWQAGSWRVGLLFILAFAGAVLLLGASARAALTAIKQWPRPEQLALRQAVGNVTRPGSQVVSITIAIGIGVMVVTTVSLVERSLLAQVGENRPMDAPTFFFIDIQPDQAEGMGGLLRQRSSGPAPRLTPLVRSRLSAVKGEPVKVEPSSEEEEQKDKSAQKEERRKKWYLAREYVLTFLQDLPKDNKVVQGEWWKPGQVFTKPLISIEEDAAKQLGVTVGDTLELDIQGSSIKGEISSVRSVEWGNFSTNFYMIFSPGALEGAPHTYVATVRVPPSDEVPLQQAVVASFPNVTAINIGDVFDSFARVLDRLSLAIRAVALFCVLSGALVMAAALAATRYRRLYESVILKALGATRGVIARSFAVEYALLGALGGFLGIALASGLSWAVLETIFDLSWSLQPGVLAMGFAATVTLTVLVGFLSTYRILGQPPLAVLRQE